MDERIRFGLYQLGGNMWSVGRVSVFGLRRYEWCHCGVGGGLGGYCESGLFVFMTGPGICIL